MAMVVDPAELESYADRLQAIMDDEGDDNVESIHVAVRTRPLNARENDLNANVVTTIEGFENGSIQIQSPETSKVQNFAFDYTFDSTFPTVDFLRRRSGSFHEEDLRPKELTRKNSDAGRTFIDQNVVFETIGLDVLGAALKGFNSSLFCYGQTGAGKTFSMTGMRSNPGIIPRLCETLFYMIENHVKDANCDVRASYLEIYNERCRDLLKPDSGELKPRDHPNSGSYVQGLSECPVNSASDIEVLLQEGLHNRTIAATLMNGQSSRSHAIFNVILTQTKEEFHNDTVSSHVKKSKIALIDLAGSESAKTSGAKGNRLRESSNINKSLTCLGRCISELAKLAAMEDARRRSSPTGGPITSPSMMRTTRSKTTNIKTGPHIPFRDSVLTWLLKDCLGGNSKTYLLVALSPADVNYSETLSSLRFASQCKKIRTKAVVNEDATTRLISELKAEVERLKAELGTQGTTAKPNRRMTMTDPAGLLEMRNNIRKNQTNEFMKTLRDRVQQHRSKLGDEDTDEWTPHLVNITSDPATTGSMTMFLKPGKTLTIGEDAKGVDIQLDGLGIEQFHCAITNLENAPKVSQNKGPPPPSGLDRISEVNLETLDDLSISRSSVAEDFGDPASRGRAESSAKSKRGSALSRSRRAKAKPSTVVIENLTEFADTFINGQRLEGKGKSSRVTLRNGDRVVFGVCAHLFQFVDPINAARRPPRRMGSSSALDENYAIDPDMLNYDRVVKEVIISRAENDEQKRDRLGRMIMSIVRRGKHNREFENRLIRALQQVETANKCASMFLNSDQVWFELHFAGSLGCGRNGWTNLLSLSANDVLRPENITIEVKAFFLCPELNQSQFKRRPSLSPSLSSVNSGGEVLSPTVSLSDNSSNTSGRRRLSLLRTPSMMMVTNSSPQSSIDIEETEPAMVIRNGSSTSDPMAFQLFACSAEGFDDFCDNLRLVQARMWNLFKALGHVKAAEQRRQQRIQKAPRRRSLSPRARGNSFRTQRRPTTNSLGIGMSPAGIEATEIDLDDEEGFDTSDGEGEVRRMHAGMRRASDLTVEKLIDELFNALDGDNDGSIMLREIGSTVRRLGLADIVEADEMEDLFNEFVEGKRPDIRRADFEPFLRHTLHFVFMVILVDCNEDPRFQYSNTDKLITYAKGKGGATFLHEMFLHEVTDLESRRGKEVAESQRNELRVQVGMLEESLARENTKIDSLRQDVERLELARQSDRTKHDAEVGRLRQDRDRLQDSQDAQAAELEAEVSHLRAELNNEQNMRRFAEETLETTKDQLNQLKSSMTSSTFVDELKGKLKDEEDEMARVRYQADRVEGERKRLSEMLSQAADESGKYKALAEVAEDQVKKQTQRVTTLEKALASAKDKIKAREGVLLNKEQELSKLRTKVKRVQEELSRYKEQLAEGTMVENELKLTKEKLLKVQQELKKAHAQLNDGDIQSTVESFFTNPFF